jgi:hypothetical protein
MIEQAVVARDVYDLYGLSSAVPVFVTVRQKGSISGFRAVGS